MRGYRGTLLLQNRRLLCAGKARFGYCKLNDVLAVHKLDTFTNSDSTNVLVHKPSLNSLGLGTPVQLHVTVRLSHECMFRPGENLAWQHYAVQVLQTNHGKFQRSLRRLRDWVCTHMHCQSAVG